jgi:hypothetical protein
MSNFQSQTAIKTLIDQQTATISKKDITGATANYSANVVLFDVVGPLQHQGVAQVKQRLKEFERCWPFSNFNPVYHFVNFVQSNDTVTVLYECETKEKKVFRNIEYIQFKGDKMIAVEVYFGRTLT